MSFSVITGDVTAELVDKDGDPVKVKNARLSVSDSHGINTLEAILEVLQSIDIRLERIEEE